MLKMILRPIFYIEQNKRVILVSPKIVDVNILNLVCSNFTKKKCITNGKNEFKANFLPRPNTAPKIGYF